MTFSYNYFEYTHKKTFLNNCRDICNDDIYNNDIALSIFKTICKQTYNSIRFNIIARNNLFLL